METRVRIGWRGPRAQCRWIRASGRCVSRARPAGRGRGALDGRLRPAAGASGDRGAVTDLASHVAHGRARAWLARRCGCGATFRAGGPGRRSGRLRQRQQEQPNKPGDLLGRSPGTDWSTSAGSGSLLSKAIRFDRNAAIYLGRHSPSGAHAKSHPQLAIRFP